MESSTQISVLNVVMGCMTFGERGKEGARIYDIKDVEEILDVFRSHGHTEIDTARTYASGTSEEYLGKIDLASKGLKLHTKLYPWKSQSGLKPSYPLDSQADKSGNGPRKLPDSESIITHDAEGLRKHLFRSLEALNVKTLDMWYLHGPDRTVAYEDTMKAVNDLYKEGYFKKFGISNYAAWEVAQIVEICKANNYILPSVYQGIYNAVHRNVEPELISCLRKFGISFYAFNAMAGGFFSDRYKSMDSIAEEGSRFDPNKAQGRNYLNRFWKESYFEALASIRTVAEKYNLTMIEVALRWMGHHSLLKREYGDSILIGASSLKHIEQNLIDLEKGPLPEEIVKALDDGWVKVKGDATPYYH